MHTLTCSLYRIVSSGGHRAHLHRFSASPFHQNSMAFRARTLCLVRCIPFILRSILNCFWIFDFQLFVPGLQSHARFQRTGPVSYDLADSPPSSSCFLQRRLCSLWTGSFIPLFPAALSLVALSQLTVSTRITLAVLKRWEGRVLLCA